MMSLDSQIRHGLEDATRHVAPSVEEALGEVTRRARRRQLGRRIAGGLAVVALMTSGVVGVVLLRAEDDEPSIAVQTDRGDATPGPVTISNDEAAVSVSLPPGWHELAPRAVVTLPELLAYGNADRVGGGPIGGCDTMTNDAVLVGIYEFLPGTTTYASPDGAPVPGPPAPRPQRFASTTPSASAVYQCASLSTDPNAILDLATGVNTEFYLFTEQNRTLLAVVAAASGAAPNEVVVAKQSLDTLRVGPPPEPDASPPPTSPPPTMPAPPPSEGADDAGATEHFEGTYRGLEHYSIDTGRCGYLDHSLHATFNLANGTTWQYDATYCGTIDGDLWSGTGTFTLTLKEGATLTGTLTSSASLPTQGEPYGLSITGGTDRFEGATGSCALDNHVKQLELGRQEQSGTFACDITR